MSELAPFLGVWARTLTTFFDPSERSSSVRTVAFIPALTFWTKQRREQHGAEKEPAPGRENVGKNGKEVAQTPVSYHYPLHMVDKPLKGRGLGAPVSGVPT